MIYRVLNLTGVVGLLPSNQSWMKDFAGKSTSVSSMTSMCISDL